MFGISAALLGVAVFFILLHPWNAKPGSMRLNLRDYPVYMKRGFHPEDINRNPAESSWDAVLPAGQRSPAKVKELLPPEEKPSLFSLFDHRTEEFTFLIPFYLDSAWMDAFDQSSMTFPNIFLGGIGDNWEIFFNGQLVLSQVHLDGEGQILQHRSWRNLLVPLHKGSFREAENYLGFRIIGSASYENTGLFYASPYFIDDFRIIERQTANQASLICSTVYVFVGLYYLLLFIMRRQARYNLYYSLFSIAVSIYFLCRHPSIYEVFSDSVVVFRIEYISLYTLVFLLGTFFEELNGQRITPVTKIYGFFVLFLAISSCIFPAEYVNRALRFWQFCGPLYFVYLVVYDVLFDFINRIIKTKKEQYRETGGSAVKAPWLKAISFNLLRTPQGNFVIVLLLIAGTSVYDVLNSIFFHTGIVLTRHSFFVFNIFSALVMAKYFSSSFNQINVLNETLETTVKLRTASLEKQVEIAESANRAKSEFMATMSHEIRTPLNAIIGLSDIELRKKHDEETFDVIKKIRRSGSTLLGIINDILDISKIEAGSFEIIPVEYETAELISDAVRLNIVRIGDKHIEFVLAADENLPSKLYGDELRIKQILNNLLSNAIKYTKAGEVKFEIFMEDANTLACRISDSGIGIRKEDIGRLFEKYSQVDTRANRKIEGTGLGLAITRMLLELMGGTVNVESEYGKGSVFTVRLPQKTLDSRPLGKEKAERLKALEFIDDENLEKIIPTAMGSTRVLVVDDVDINLEVARGLMEPYGLAVECVLSGKEAVELIRKGEPRFDMILMDHMMPGMDGIEAVRIIRNEIDSEYARKIPIIALTANALAGYEEMFLSSGFSGFISKPIDIVRLDEMLKKFARSPL
ncbi:hypothetical protein AGMMS49928_19320 [Spirochaetia bacterium]|nr:hypothetical protein AGMMS49928_19320 [Spirochaetia bacterium]